MSEAENHPNPSSAELTPCVLGRYRCLEVLLDSGLRRVWRVFDEVTGLERVLKGIVSAPELEADDATYADEVLGLRREFERLQHLQHPLLPSCFDLMCIEPFNSGPSRHGSSGHGSGQPRQTWFSQELVTGRSLKSQLGQVPIPALRQCLMEVLGLVAWLHAQKQLGLDLKPEHLFQEGQRWRLIDLDQLRIDDLLAAPTRVGAVRYLAPEVLCGQPLEARADLYALGRVLQEAIVGSLPSLEGSTFLEWGEQLRIQALPEFPPELESQDPGLFRVLRSLLEPDVRNRPTALEALGWLEPFPRLRLPCPPLPLVGCETLLTELTHQLTHSPTHPFSDPLTRGGEGASAMRICAPARAGRTRLLRTLAARLQSDGHPVLLLEPERPEIGPASPVQQLLRFVLCQARQRGLSEPDGTLPLLHRLLSLSRMMQEVSETRLCILVDDWQSLDETTTALLRSLVPLLPEVGLVLVLAERLEDVPSAPHAQSAPLPTDPVASQPVWTLPALTLDDVQQVAESALGAGRLDESALQLLQSLCYGNAGLIQERIEQLWYAPDEPAEVAMARPLTGDENAVTEVLARRLTPATQQILTTLSLLDTPFHKSLALQLASALGMTSAEVEAGLGWLIEHDWLKWVASSPQSAPRESLLAFVHPHLKLRLAGTIPEALRRQRHRHIAERLERRRHHEGASSQQIARHFLKAGQPERARSHLFMALELMTPEATTSQTFTPGTPSERRTELCGEAAETIACLRQLITLLDDDDPDRQSLLLRLGEAELFRERFGEALTALEAVEASITVGAPLSPVEQARCLGALGSAEAVLGRLASSRQHLTLALQRAEVADATLLPERIMEWSHRLVWVCLATQAQTDAKQLLAGLRRSGVPPGSRFEVEQVRYEEWLLLEQVPPDETGGLSEGLVRLEQALTLAERLEDSRRILTLLNLIERFCERLGMRERAITCLRRAAHLSHQSFDLVREAAANQNLGRLLRQEGEYSEALSCFERSVALNHRLGNRSAEARSQIACAELMVDLERNLNRAEELLRQAGSHVPPDSQDQLWLELVQHRLTLKQGAMLGLETRLEALRLRCASVQQPTRVLETLLIELELALEQRRTEHACHLAELGNRWLQPETPPGLKQRYHRLAAQAHLMEAGLEGELRGLQDVLLPGERLERNDTEKTAPQREPSPEVFPGLGLTTWLEQSESLLRVADDPRSLLGTLARQVGELLQGRGLTLLMTGNKPDVVAGAGVTREQQEVISTTIIEEALRTQRPWWCDNVQLKLAERARSLRSSRVQSVACLPLLHRERLLGFLYVDHHEEGRVTHPEVKALLIRVANMATRLLVERLEPTPLPVAGAPDLGLVGNSPSMQRLREKVRLYTRSTSEVLKVLLLGPPGTGKTYIAKQIHRHGPREKNPLIVRSLGMPQEGTLDSTLFGHLKGSFTGAMSDKRGDFGEAAGGTLVLDEIGDLPLELQPKLLTALQDRMYMPLGSSQGRKVSCHLLFTTNVDLAQRVKEGRFRWDLLTRLAVNVLQVPSLRERGPEDIRLLIEHQLGKLSLDGKQPAFPTLEQLFAPPALDLLLRYSWPGNVRELENLFDNEVMKNRLQFREHRIRQQEVEEILHAVHQNQTAVTPSLPPSSSLLPPGRSFKELEKWAEMAIAEYFVQVYLRNHENASRTADELQCTRKTTYRYLGLAGIKVRE